MAGVPVHRGPKPAIATVRANPGPMRGRWVVACDVVPRPRSGFVFRRRAGRAAPAPPVDAGSARLGALIEAALGRRSRTSGVELSPWELPITVACRDLVADTVAQLPFVAYRAGQARDDQPAVCVRPDPTEPAWLTKHRLVNSLTRHGYAWLLPRWGRDSVASVHVLSAPEATGMFDPAGRLLEVWHLGQRFDPAKYEIMWVPWRVEGPGDLGTSPIAACWQAVTYLAALYEMAGSFWEAGFPSVALMLEQALTKTQRLELREQLYGAWSRRHEPAIVDRGGRLEPVGSNAVDAQLVESVEWANTEIARAFGVMPSLVNVRAGDSLTYATTEAEMGKWLKIGLGRYLSRIEAAWTDLTVYGTTVRADTGELLRSDGAARAAFYESAIRAGWLEPAEIRAREGLPPPRASDRVRALTVAADPPAIAPPLSA